MEASSEHGAAKADAPSAPSSRSAPPSPSAPLTELGSGGARALQQAIGNAAMGRLLRSRMVARDSVLTMNAPAEREIGPNDRPPAKVFFDAYSKVSYDVWKKGVNPPSTAPEKQQNGPWEFVGGSVGKMFGATDPSNPAAGPHLPEHTCAARLSWALNHGFAATQIKSGAMFYNDPKVTYAGKPGDGKNYIVGAPAMQTYLTKMWGPPDVKLSNLDVEGVDVSTGAPFKSPGDASALRTRLGPTGVAVFAGAHHAGVISQLLKTDDYIYYDPTVVPAVAWILP